MITFIATFMFVFFFKLRALGVRECIHSVIKDLKEDIPAFGEEPESK